MYQLWHRLGLLRDKKEALLQEETKFNKATRTTQKHYGYHTPPNTPYTYQQHNLYTTCQQFFLPFFSSLTLTKVTHVREKGSSKEYV